MMSLKNVKEEKAVSSNVLLVLLWAWFFGFIGTLIYLHKKKYFPK